MNRIAYGRRKEGNPAGEAPAACLTGGGAARWRRRRERPHGLDAMNCGCKCPSPPASGMGEPADDPWLNCMGSRQPGRRGAAQ